MTQRRKVGVIVNPLSHKNKSSISALVAVLGQQEDVPHVILRDVATIPDDLRKFSKQGVEVVAVAGGDGTVQLVLNGILHDRCFETQPLIAILPRGRTNMTAADIGVKGRGARGLDRLLVAAGRTNFDQYVVERRILCVENVKDLPPQFGMFFGGAGIWRAVDYTRRKVHPLAMGADATSALAFARLLIHLLRLGKGEDDLFRGDDIEICVDGETVDRGTSLVVLATTLDKLLLGSRPFWGIGKGNFAFTQFAHPAYRLWRYTWRLLFGAVDRSLPDPHYYSTGADRVELKMSCPFTLDGADLEPDETNSMILTADRKIGFVRL